MCGISAIISSDLINIDEIKMMNKLIAHRGPDDEGFYLTSSKNKNFKQCSGEGSCTEIKAQFDNISSVSEHEFNVALGHRRLSIIDLSHIGHQPMRCYHQRYILIFNGEIYNYKIIREKLRSHGIKFKSDSDTEVVVNAWSVWGAKSLNLLEGMFSFILYDQYDGKIHAVRDRFGIKPLYYFYPDNGSICFASEIKQFTTHKKWNAQQNYQIVYDFLNWSLIDHTNETFFKDVYQVLPGEYLSISITDNELRINKTKWYSLSIITSSDSYEIEVENFKSLLLNSVKDHLNSDVPVGSCLSGGIDSSSIVGIINTCKSGQQTQKTFSALSDDPNLDEGKWVNYVRRKYDIDSYSITPTVELLDASLNDLVYHQDEPFRTTSTFAQWCVFKLAKENNIKVMLDGQGADEQLGGYGSFWGVLLAEKLKHFDLSEFFTEYRYIKHNSRVSHYQLLQRTANPFVTGPFSNIIRRVFTDNYAQPNWLNIDNKNIYPNDPHQVLGARTQSFQEYSIAQLQHTNLQSLLHLEDRNSMAHSIEARVPFLDHKLVEKSISAPTVHKFHHGVSKRILRDSMVDYLPNEIYNRYDKIGFATSEEKWMKSSRKPFFYDLVLQAVNNENSIVNKNIMPEIDSIFSGVKSFNSLPWRIISYGKWLKCFNVN